MSDPYQWVSISRGCPLPAGAVMSGHTRTDGDIYVGRIGGEVGKVNLDNGRIYNIWSHKGGHNQHCELLVLRPGTSFEWSPYASGESLPDGAVRAGVTQTDGIHSVCVAREKHGVCGKLNLTDDGRLHNLWVHNSSAWKEGEILVVTSAEDEAFQTVPLLYEWVPFQQGQHILSGAVMSGHTFSDLDVYVGRNESGEVGKVNFDKGLICKIWCHHGGWSEHGDFLVLRPGATFEWKPWKAQEPLPRGAVWAGSTKTDGRHGVFVARDRHGACGKLNLTDDGLLCGLWTHGHITPWREGDILLIHPPECTPGFALAPAAPMPGALYQWVPTSRGQPVQAGAVMSGHTRTDLDVYVGRSEGEIGKVNLFNGQVYNIWTHHAGSHQHGDLLVLRAGVTVEWRPFKSGDEVPVGAVCAGVTKTDGRHGVLVARTKHGCCGKLNIEDDGRRLCKLWVHGSMTAWKAGQILLVNDAGCSSAFGSPQAMHFANASMFEWVRVSRGQALPAGAVMSGHTGSDGDVYVGRNDVGEVGKVNTDKGLVYNFWCHNVGDSQHGDVLVLHPGATFEWRPFKSGELAPDGRVFAGTTKTDGKHGIFVARDKHGACGKLSLTDAGNLCSLRVHYVSTHGSWRAKLGAQLCGRRVHGYSACQDGEILLVTGAAYDPASAASSCGHTSMGSYLPAASSAASSVYAGTPWGGHHSTSDGGYMPAVAVAVPVAVPGWNYNILCDGLIAGERAEYFEQQEGLSMDAARQRVMREFPAQFAGKAP